MKNKIIAFMLAVVALQEVKSQVMFTGFYPGKEQSIHLDDEIVLRYTEQGNPDGIPLLLIHGFTDSWRSFENFNTYLTGDLHVFAISLRGHGMSSKPDSGYHPADFAKDIAAFIIKKQLGAVYVAGHSMGGLIAQQLALDFPELLKGIVLISTNPGFAGNKGLDDFYSAINALEDPVDTAFVTAFQAGTFSRVDSTILEMAIEESLRVPARVWKAVMNQLRSSNYVSRLGEISVPVLIMWGDKDTICSQEDQRILYERIRNAKLMIYSRRGHALHWESPRQVAGDIVDFIMEKENIDCY